VVTRGGQALGANAAVSPLQTCLAGLGRIVKAEHPNFHPVVVDLAPGSDSAHETRFLFEELLARNPEDLVAIREGVRYVPRLQRDRRGVPASSVNITNDATYLITGGLGALGLQVAQWLAGKGARHLTLISRSKPSDSARESIHALERLGVDVKALQADVANAEDLRRVLIAVDPSTPLRGVIHAAGSLDDGLLVQQSWERFSKVLAAKVTGAWNLHEVTKDFPLDFFVLFSSASSLLGSPGQASYAAANSFLDGLAAHRRSLGLPGVSIAWGAWSGSGMAARLSERERRLWADQGIGALKPEQGLEELALLLSWPSPQVAVLSVDWTRFVRQYPTGGELPLLSELAREARLQAQSESPAPERVRLLRRLEESSPAERLEILAEFVRGQVAEVLGYSSSSNLDANQGFFEIGMDSLMAVDLQRRLQNGLGVTLSSTVGFDHPTIEALAKYLAENAIAFQSTVAQPAAAPAVVTKQAAEEARLEAMSEDELVALFSKELARTDQAKSLEPKKAWTTQ
jgi:NAD(P)-dependent dehydrogenase (short-subunit alcohol dehydrogenase family)/acyl carrier protein